MQMRETAFKARKDSWAQPSRITALYAAMSLCGKHKRKQGYCRHRRL
jgi:hypothetical protein